MTNIFKTLWKEIKNIFNPSPKGNKISVSDLSQQKIKYAEQIAEVLTNIRIYNSIKKGESRLYNPKELLNEKLPKLWENSAICKTRLALANAGIGIEKRIPISKIKESQQYRIAYRGHIKETSDFLQKMITGKDEFNSCCKIGKDMNTIYTKTDLKGIIQILQISLKNTQEEMDNYNMYTFFLL